jgi:hypothetical protein
VPFVGGDSAARCRRCRASPLADTGTLTGTVLALTLCTHGDHPNLRNNKGPPDRSRAGLTVSDRDASGLKSLGEIPPVQTLKS